MIGDGVEGGAPISFSLDPGDSIDVGYMKVFWSTDPLELNDLEQESAFELEVGRRSRKAENWTAGSMGQWGSTLLTLVQRSPTNQKTCK